MHRPPLLLDVDGIGDVGHGCTRTAADVSAPDNISDVYIDVSADSVNVAWKCSDTEDARYINIVEGEILVLNTFLKMKLNISNIGHIIIKKQSTFSIFIFSFKFFKFDFIYIPLKILQYNLNVDLFTVLIYKSLAVFLSFKILFFFSGCLICPLSFPISTKPLPIKRFAFFKQSKFAS